MKNLDEIKEDSLQDIWSRTKIVPKFDKTRQVLICRVGSEERPATTEDLEQVKYQLDAILKASEEKPNDRIFVITHHVFDCIILDKDQLKGAAIIAGQVIDENNEIESGKS